MKQQDAITAGINMMQRIGMRIASRGVAVVPVTQSE